MINIYFFIKKNKEITGFKIEGHSNFYKKLGRKIKKVLFKKRMLDSKDYICSAVSAVSYMTVTGLKNSSNNHIEFKVDGTGFMECYLKEDPNRESNLLFSSLLEILKKIMDEYPGHIEIKMEENNGT